MSEEKKYNKVYCSQCGGEFGPRNSGYSHCSDHIKEQKQKMSGKMPISKQDFDEMLDEMRKKSSDYESINEEIKPKINEDGFGCHNIECLYHSTINDLCPSYKCTNPADVPYIPQNVCPHWLRAQLTELESLREFKRKIEADVKNTVKNTRFVDIEKAFKERSILWGISLEGEDE